MRLRAVLAAALLLLSAPALATLPASAEDGHVRASVTAVVVRNGNGAWARNAYWDEYTVQLQPLRSGLRLEQAVLVGWLGEPVEVSDYYAMLWQRSEEARERYQQVGVLLTLGTPQRLTTMLFAGSGGVGVGVGAQPARRTPPRGEEAAKVQAELERRMPELPLALSGEARVSLFFPVTPGPKRLRLFFAGEEGRHVLEVPLEASLGRLHLSDKRPTGKARVLPRE